MIEKLYKLTQTEDKKIEKVVSDQNVHYNHMVLPKGEALPEHFSNSNVYMYVIRGTVSLRLGDQDTHQYPKGSLLNIPNNIKMNVFNELDEVCEITVVKAPAPGTF